jgi:hypothetical protein
MQRRSSHATSSLRSSRRFGCCTCLLHGARDAPFGTRQCDRTPKRRLDFAQLRAVVGDERGHQYLIHDRDKTFAKHLDDSIRALGAEVLRSPIASPKANSLCERVIGTIRRECLDWMIPLSEGHLRSILKSWVEHYNRGRPHSSLGPGVRDPPPILATIRKLEPVIDWGKVSLYSESRCWVDSIMNIRWHRASPEDGEIDKLDATRVIAEDRRQATLAGLDRRVLKREIFVATATTIRSA